MSVFFTIITVVIITILMERFIQTNTQYLKTYTKLNTFSTSSNEGGAV